MVSGSKNYRIHGRERLREEGENEPRVCFPRIYRGGLKPGERVKNEIRSEKWGKWERSE